MGLKMLYSHVQRIMAQCSITSGITRVCSGTSVTSCLLPAPSAGLLMAPSYVEQSTHWREGMLSKGTWRGGSVQASWCSRPSARSCPWVRAIPSTNTDWVENGLRAEGLGTGRQEAQHEPVMCT